MGDLESRRDEAWDIVDARRFVARRERRWRMREVRVSGRVRCGGRER